MIQNSFVKLAPFTKLPANVPRLESGMVMFLQFLKPFWRTGREAVSKWQNTCFLFQVQFLTLLNKTFQIARLRGYHLWSWANILISHTTALASQFLHPEDSICPLMYAANHNHGWNTGIHHDFCCSCLHCKDTQSTIGHRARPGCHVQMWMSTFP